MNLLSPFQLVDLKLLSNKLFVGLVVESAPAEKPTLSKQ